MSVKFWEYQWILNSVVSPDVIDMQKNRRLGLYGNFTNITKS